MLLFWLICISRPSVFVAVALVKKLCAVETQLFCIFVAPGKH
jgi:hypothetical protein